VASKINKHAAGAIFRGAGMATSDGSRYSKIMVERLEKSRARTLYQRGKEMRQPEIQDLQS
jgi:hypothetical protein